MARIRRPFIVAVLVALPAIVPTVLGRTLLVGAVHAQVGPSEDAKIWTGVYTSDQAQRGQKVYEALCTRCHGLDLLGSRNAGSGPALRDTNFWVDWERAPLSSLLSKIQRTMPYDSPGSLRDDDYTDVLSFLLSKNGFPAGSSALAPAGLAEIRIMRPAGTAAEVPNFSVVQVVGCLAEGAETRWVLTNATAPKLTREETPSAADLKAAATLPAGTAQLRLIGVTQFKPEASLGRKVEARGLLNKASDDVTLDVLSLQAVSASCAN